MKAIFSLTIFVGALLPLVILLFLYGWFRRRVDSPNYWPMTGIVALTLAVVRTALVYGGFYTAANPFMSMPLRICAVICGMLVLPESVLLLKMQPAHASRGEQHLILAIVTFAGAVLWTIALATLARWVARKPENQADPETPPANP